MKAKKKNPHKQIRVTWGFNPKPRVKEDKKNIYKRVQDKTNLKKELKQGEQ
jgi:hypothetical protein